MDDPLSAVDANVAHHIFYNAITGVLRGKTVVLATHQIHLLPALDQLLVLKEDRIQEQGTYEQLIKANGDFARLVEEFAHHHPADGGEHDGDTDAQEQQLGHYIKDIEDQAHGNHEFENDNKNDNKDTRTTTTVINEQSTQDQTTAQATTTTTTTTTTVAEDDGTLMVTEERGIGAVKFQLYIDYALVAGSVVLPIALLVAFAASHTAKVAVDAWLAVWSSDRFELSIWAYIGTYTALSLLSIVVYGSTRAFMALLAIRNARAMHSQLLTSILHAPMSFFESTPVGRILNRFAKDQDSIDFSLPISMENYLTTASVCIGTIILVACATPVSIVGLVPLLYVYYRVQDYYRKSSIELKRIESISRSPLFAHFSESLEGVVSIRAYGAQARFVQGNHKLLDHNIRTFLPLIAANRWLAIRLDFGCYCIVALAGLVAVFGRNLFNASLVSLSLSYAYTTIDWLSWLVRATAELEQNMNSVERILHYTRTEPEAPHDIAAVDHQLDYWPMHGAISFHDATLRYRGVATLPALDRVSFAVRPRERVGVCGRTGAGKSSLLAALFRLVELSSGVIDIDGINIAEIGLRKLRKSLAIIPQVTTRSNSS
jgi:ABC-type multidrug transport system fused ATPase/permease subunit